MSLPSPDLSPPSLDLWEFSFNGLTFGGVDVPTDTYPFVQATGLDMPAVQSTDDPRPFDQGTFIGWDLYSARTILVQVIVRPFAGQTLRQEMNALKAVLKLGLNTETPLYLDTGNGVQCVMARVRQMPYVIDVNWLLGEGVVVEIGFQATDPRVYSTPTLASSCNTGSDLQGWTFPWTFPWTFTPGVVSGSVEANNQGDFEMRPTLVLTGPLTEPTITNSSIEGTPALTFAIPGGSGLTLQDGEQLVIDTDLHSITLYEPGSAQGSSRENWLVWGSTWWNIPPGDNLIALTSESSTDTGTLTVEYASAYDAA